MFHFVKNNALYFFSSYRPGSIETQYVKSELAFADADWPAFADLVGIRYTDRSRKLVDCKTTVLTL